MGITLKTPDQIKKMRESCRILWELLIKAKMYVAPGITTEELDRRIADDMKKYPVTPAFLGYHGFPKVSCINVNEEVVHAIPGKRTMNEGDIVSIDCGVIYEGWYSDCAVTIGVGTISPGHAQFIKTAEKALEAGIAQVKPGNKVGDIGHAIQAIVEKAGYSVVKDYVGHGIGRALHEEPEVPNFGKPGKGIALKPGMTLAIEPIINMGQRFTKILEDRWTVVTTDLSRAAQVEKTVLVTESGVEILTRE